MSSNAFLPDSSPPLLPNNHKPVSNHGQIYGGVIIAIGVLFIGAGLLFCFRRKLWVKFKPIGKHKGKLDADKLKLRHFTLEELHKATKNFSPSCLVGSGAFGDIYCGTFEIEGNLAIKKLRSESYLSAEEFKNEVILLSKVKHDNLVGLVGFCEGSGPQAENILVYEFVAKGSLLEYIMGRGRRSLTWRERFKIAIGAAKGIAHLHEGISPSIIHRDVKPSNILIGEGFEAKVSDFGTVRSGPVGDQSHVSSQIKGTPGYLDPAYCSSFHLTPFSDVYSFGVILLQLITARPANEPIGSNAHLHIIDWARPSIERGAIEDTLDVNLIQEECNMELMLTMGKIALRCVAKVPKGRPTMTQVWQELEKALKSMDEMLLLEQALAEGSPIRIATNKGSRCEGAHKSSIEQDYSGSIVNVDGIGLQRFHVDMDSMSFKSASLRCLEMSVTMNDEFCIAR